MTDSPPRVVLTYEMFGVAARELSRQIADDGYRPDMIVALARGGLPVGCALSYALAVKNVTTINVEFYTGVDERLDMPVMLPPVPQAVDWAGAKILVVDDVADTGGTLALIKEFCAEHVQDVRCAVLYEKPRSIVQCEYAWRRADDWIEFPWSSEDPVVDAVNRDA